VSGARTSALRQSNANPQLVVGAARVPPTRLLWDLRGPGRVIYAIEAAISGYVHGRAPHCPQLLFVDWALEVTCPLDANEEPDYISC
jgi:hypothetical protein